MKQSHVLVTFAAVGIMVVAALALRQMHATLSTLHQTIQDADDTIKNVNAIIVPSVVGLLEITSAAVSNTDAVVEKLGGQIETLANEGLSCIKAIDTNVNNFNGFVDIVELKPIRRGFAYVVKNAYQNALACCGYPTKSPVKHD